MFISQVACVELCSSSFFSLLWLLLLLHKVCMLCFIHIHSNSFRNRYQFEPFFFLLLFLPLSSSLCKYLELAELCVCVFVFAIKQLVKNWNIKHTGFNDDDWDNMVSDFGDEPVMVTMILSLSGELNGVFLLVVVVLYEVMHLNRFKVMRFWKKYKAT